MQVFWRSVYDDMVKASWSKYSGINYICCILNYVSKDEESVKVFGAEVEILENNRSFQVICINNLTRLPSCIETNGKTQHTSFEIP